MAMHGVLNTYDTDNRLCYFESGNSANDTCITTSNSVIFIGGLGDAFNAIPVLPQLSNALSEKCGWSLIQVQTRSSSSGWAMGDIDRDVEDLRTLEQHLRKTHGEKARLVLLGHSTGCQDIVRFFKVYPTSTYSAAILQGPVSDREIWERDTPPDILQKSLAVAQRQHDEGDGAYPLPRWILDLIAKGIGLAPVSADRWLSLALPAGHGKEDFFSSDLTDQQVGDAFSGLKAAGIPALIVIGGSDEYVPALVDKQKLLNRWTSAIGPPLVHSLSQVLRGADHSLTAPESMRNFVMLVTDFVKGL